MKSSRCPACFFITVLLLWVPGLGRAQNYNDLLPQNRDLLEATHRGRFWEVKHLLEQGANVNLSEPGPDMTPLMYAACRGEERMVRLLLSQGAAVNARDMSRLTALAWAAIKGYDRLVRLLVDKGSDPQSRQDALGAAALFGHKRILLYLLSKETSINAFDETGDTPLMRAASANRLDLVKLLVRRGAEVNRKDLHGRTALMAATGPSAKRWEVAQFLIEHGADLNAKDEDGYTALKRAQESGSQSMVKYLRKVGAKE